jgi:hypothetical protein
MVVIASGWRRLEKDHHGWSVRAPIWLVPRVTMPPVCRWIADGPLSDCDQTARKYGVLQVWCESLLRVEVQAGLPDPWGSE